MASWSIYVLRCCDGSYYTGIATDVARRLGEHAAGKRGAKYLRGRAPFEIVYQRQVGDRGTATRIEYQVKQLRRQDKQDLARIDALVERLASPGACA